MYHQGDFQGDLGNWRTTVDYTAVSDRDYFRNLGTGLDVSSRRELERFGETCSTPINAVMGSEDLRRHCRLEDDARKLLDRAFERLKLSARAVTRILKVARTIADLEGSERIRA